MRAHIGALLLRSIIWDATACILTLNIIVALTQFVWQSKGGGEAPLRDHRVECAVKSFSIFDELWSSTEFEATFVKGGERNPHSHRRTGGIFKKKAMSPYVIDQHFGMTSDVTRCVGRGSMSHSGFHSASWPKPLRKTSFHRVSQVLIIAHWRKKCIGLRH